MSSLLIATTFTLLFLDIPKSTSKNAFLDISMVYDSILKVYRYNDEIYVTEAKVNESSVDEFNLLILTNKTKIEDVKKAEALKTKKAVQKLNSSADKSTLGDLDALQSLKEQMDKKD